MTEKTELMFSDLGLSSEILEAIEKKGFTKPSPIQAGIIPLLLKGEKDIIGQAQTGTGKTAAFALPLLERLDSNVKETQAIILAPTRELAIQVSKEIESFRIKNSPDVTVIYGGNNMRTEVSSLRKMPNIVVGTPGRIQHHIRNKVLKLENIKYFVLDEADEMLNFGFRSEIEEILSLTPPERKVLLFSATMPKSIMDIVNNYMHEYDTVKIDPKEMTNENISQKYYTIRDFDKFEALCQIMESEENFYAIVFCKTKSDTEVIANKLINKHLKAEALNGDIDQSKREKILNRFKSGSTNILVATDVAARGIDVAELNFVVNYSIPENHEIYTHRIGRTGRAGNKGTAITFINGSEVSKFNFFQKKLNIVMKKGILPTPDQLVLKKQKHLIERIEETIGGEHEKYLIPFAKELLEKGESLDVIVALLQDAYSNDFNPNNYKTIVEDKARSGSGNNRGGRVNRT